MHHHHSFGMLMDNEGHSPDTVKSRLDVALLELNTFQIISSIDLRELDFEGRVISRNIIYSFGSAHRIASAHQELRDIIASLQSLAFLTFTHFRSAYTCNSQIHESFIPSTTTPSLINSSIHPIVILLPPSKRQFLFHFFPSTILFPYHSPNPILFDLS